MERQPEQTLLYTRNIGMYCSLARFGEKEGMDARVTVVSRDSVFLV